MAPYDDIDDATRIIGPDILLPAQLFAERVAANDPERRLMLALLEDAVHCFQAHLFATEPRTQRVFADAAAWFASRDPSPFFSFENVCSVLGLDPDWLRSGLQRWRAAGEAQRTANAHAAPGGTSAGVRPRAHQRNRDGRRRMVA